MQASGVLKLERMWPTSLEFERSENGRCWFIIKVESVISCRHSEWKGDQTFFGCFEDDPFFM